VERFYVLAVKGRRSGGSYACELKVAGSTGNVYAVGLRDGVLTCDCPDSAKMGRRTCCKHLAFLLLKVGRLMDTGYFSTRSLTRGEERALEDRLEDVSRGPVDPLRTVYAMRLRTAERSAAKAAKSFRAGSSSDDDCPICYEALKDTLELAGCPTCRKAVHVACMMRWLETADRATCVYCRSGAWAAFARRETASSYVNVFA
jgi:hypothetical protein